MGKSSVKNMALEALRETSGGPQILEFNPCWLLTTSLAGHAEPGYIRERLSESTSTETTLDYRTKWAWPSPQPPPAVLDRPSTRVIVQISCDTGQFGAASVARRLEWSRAFGFLRGGGRLKCEALRWRGHATVG